MFILKILSRNIKLSDHANLDRRKADNEMFSLSSRRLLQVCLPLPPWQIYKTLGPKYSHKFVAVLMLNILCFYALLPNLWYVNKFSKTPDRFFLILFYQLCSYYANTDRQTNRRKTHMPNMTVIFWDC